MGKPIDAVTKISRLKNSLGRLDHLLGDFDFWGRRPVGNFIARFSTVFHVHNSHAARRDLRAPRDWQKASTFPRWIRAARRDLRAPRGWQKASTFPRWIRAARRDLRAPRGWQKASTFPRW